MMMMMMVMVMTLLAITLVTSLSPELSFSSITPISTTQYPALPHNKQLWKKGNCN